MSRSVHIINFLYDRTCPIKFIDINFTITTKNHLGYIRIQCMKYALGRVINVPNEMMNRIANNTAKGLDSDSIEPGDDSMDESPSNEEPRQHIVAGVVYQHVSNLEDGVLEESIEQHSSSGTFTWERFWFRTIFSDNQFTLARVKLLDGAPAVKLLKFYMLTLIGIVSWFYFVRWVVSI